MSQALPPEVVAAAGGGHPRAARRVVVAAPDVRAFTAWRRRHGLSNRIAVCLTRHTEERCQGFHFGEGATTPLTRLELALLPGWESAGTGVRSMVQQLQEGLQGAGDSCRAPAGAPCSCPWCLRHDRQAPRPRPQPFDFTDDLETR